MKTTIRRLFLALVLVLTAVVITGCGKKECLTCPSDTPTAPTVFTVTVTASSASAFASVVCPNGGTATATATSLLTLTITIEAKTEADARAKAQVMVDAQMTAQATATATATCTSAPPPTCPPGQVGTPPNCTTPPPAPGPTHCAVSDWGPWSAWTPINSTTEQRTRSRSVVTPPSNGGQSCPNLTETETRPITPPVCTHSLAPETISASDYRASNGSIAVGGTCPSTMSSNVPWFSVAVGGGSGNWSSPYSMSENGATTARNGLVTVTWQDGFVKTIPVTQPGKPAEATCSYSITMPPSSVNVSRDGLDGSIIVGVNGPNPAACTWGFSVSHFWLGVNPSTGAGNSVPGNAPRLIIGGNTTGASRPGSVTFTGIGGFTRTFNFTQGG